MPRLLRICIYTSPMNLRAHRYLVPCSFGFLLTGCANSGLVREIAPLETVGLKGAIHGGQQPVSLSSIQMYAVDVNNGFTPLLNPTVSSDTNGNFSLNGGIYTCPPAPAPIVLMATNGNPGLTKGTNNTAISLAAALGDCGNLSSSTFITIDETTTVAFAAVYQSILNASTQADIEAAFTTAAMFANVTTGTSPGVGQASSDQGGKIPVDEINTLANILATCVNTDGSTGSSTSCGNLFALTGSPANTFNAVTNLEASPQSYNTSAIYQLATTSGPFQPTLTSAPTSWAVQLVPGSGPGLLTASPNAGTVGDRIFITSNNPSATASICPFTPPISISFGSVAASGSFTSSSIMAIVPSGTPTGNITGTVTTTSGSCTFSFFEQATSSYALSTTTMAFGNQTAGTQSTSMTVTFTNNNGSNSGAAVTVNAASITGTNAASFLKTADSCSGQSLALGASCSVSVAFKPAATGSASASLGFTVGGSLLPASVALSGTGN